MLSSFGWDSQEDLVVITREQILKTLNKFIEGQISELDLEEWSEAIECREDISFDKNHREVISEIIFELANPKIAGDLTKEKVKYLIKKLGI